MNELFPQEQVAVKSPRMLWMERYAVTIWDHGDAIEDELGEHARFQAQGRSGLGMPHYTEGKTEDEAIAALAIKLRVKLWNEEQL